MKIARFFAAILGCIGVLLLLGSMSFFLLNRNAPVRILELPQEAVSVAEDFVKDLNEGNLEAAAQLMYGQPDLGVGTVPASVESAILWDAFCSSIAVEPVGDWNVEQGCLVRNVSITNLDVSTVLGKIPERVQPLLDQRIAAAENLAEIYDENNDFREELVEEVLHQALQQSLSQDGQSVTRELPLKLINRDGRWWVVPHQNLLQILTGLA